MLDFQASLMRLFVASSADAGTLCITGDGDRLRPQIYQATSVEVGAHGDPAYEVGESWIPRGRNRHGEAVSLSPAATKRNRRGYVGAGRNSQQSLSSGLQVVRAR